MKNFLFVLTVFSLVFCNKKSETEITEVKTDTLVQKDGKILEYKVYGKPLITLKRDHTVYSAAYLKRIEKLVHYYFDKSQLSNVLFQLEKPDARLGYSTEETDWEGVKYTQIGLFSRTQNNIVTFQWLFYDAKNQKLYEFDVPKNTPILFKYP